MHVFEALCKCTKISTMINEFQVGSVNIYFSSRLSSLLKVFKRPYGIIWKKLWYFYLKLYSMWSVSLNIIFLSILKCQTRKIRTYLRCWNKHNNTNFHYLKVVGNLQLRLDAKQIVKAFLAWAGFKEFIHMRMSNLYFFL